MPAQQLKGAAVAGAAAAALLVLSFLDWFGGATMWQSFTVSDLLAAIAIAAGLAQAISAVVLRSIAGAISLGSTSMLLGLIGLVALLTGLVNPPSDADRELAAWLGLLAAAGIVVGGYVGVLEDDPGRPAP